MARIYFLGRFVDNQLNTMAKICDVVENSSDTKRNQTTLQVLKVQGDKVEQYLSIYTRLIKTAPTNETQTNAIYSVLKWQNHSIQDRIKNLQAGIADQQIFRARRGPSPQEELRSTLVKVVETSKVESETSDLRQRVLQAANAPANSPEQGKAIADLTGELLSLP